jgi:hypothetical protein
MSPLGNGDAQALIIYFPKEFSSYLAAMVYIFIPTFIRLFRTDDYYVWFNLGLWVSG